MPQADADPAAGVSAGPGAAPRAASDIDDVVGRALADLDALPGVLRAGFALNEGGGRRLRYTASDRDRDHGTSLDWCHIDAYDDVPLTVVVRTGVPLCCDRAALDRRFPDYAGRQEPEVLAVAALPLPGPGAPIGGFLLLLDRPWADGDALMTEMAASARQIAEAVRGARVRSLPATMGQQGAGARLMLADDPRSAGLARRFLREVLTAHDGVSDDQLDTAQLCLSELVTNALVHAGGESELVVTVQDGVLTCTVRDRGTASEPAEPGDALADPMRVHGRGLQLIDMLVDRWGSERGAVGTSTWFALVLGGSPDRGVPGAQQAG